MVRQTESLDKVVGDMFQNIFTPSHLKNDIRFSPHFKGFCIHLSFFPYKGEIASTCNFSLRVIQDIKRKRMPYNRIIIMKMNIIENLLGKTLY